MRKKKLVSVGLALVLALSLSLVTAVPALADAPAINGTIGEGEWDGATVIDIIGGMGTVSVIAESGYLYVLFEVTDSTDARTQYEGEVGNDQISINVNPTDGGSWGFPYDLIFETSALSGGGEGGPDDGGHHWLPWNPKENSGTLDGWATRWFPDDTQEALPDDLESATVYSNGQRITEWKLPLASNGVPKVGGAIDVGDGNSYVYPANLDWNTASTFVTLHSPTLILENKNPADWSVIADDTAGTLHYALSGSEFEYNFRATGLEGEEVVGYALIYYADYEERFDDWGGDNPGAVIGYFKTDGNGTILTVSGSVDLGMDLPCPPDANMYEHNYTEPPDEYANAHGAKIWLVPTSALTESMPELPVIVWAPATFLFETDLITYNDTDWPEFEFDEVGNQEAGVAFSINITARYDNGETDTSYTGTAALADSTGTIDPVVTGAFVDGNWTGDVTITEADVTIIQATDGDIIGTEGPFVVYPGPVATIEIDPKDSYIIFFNCEDYNHYLYDEYGNETEGDVVYSIDEAAGEMDNSDYCDGVAGVWTVTVTYWEDEEPTEITDTASLRVYNWLSRLRDGWTLISTPKHLDPDSAFETDVLLVYRYVAGEGYLSIDRFGGELDLNDLEPVEAFYVKCAEEEGGRVVGLIWSDGVQGVSNKELAAGWNLVSTACLLDAYTVMSPLRYIDVGEEQGVGLTTIVSQKFYQFSLGFQLPALTQGDWNNELREQLLWPFNGYWVYMNGAKVFGVIPDGVMNWEMPQ